MIKRRKKRRRGVSEDFFKFHFFPANLLVLHCQGTDSQFSTAESKRISKLRVYILKVFLNWTQYRICCCMKMNIMEAEAGLFNRHTICEILSRFYLRLPSASYIALLARENIRKKYQSINTPHESRSEERRDFTREKNATLKSATMECEVAPRWLRNTCNPILGILKKQRFGGWKEEKRTREEDDGGKKNVRRLTWAK